MFHWPIFYDCLSVVAELAELKRKKTETEKAAEKAKQKKKNSRTRTEMLKNWNR